MAERSDSLCPSRPVPYLLARVATQDVTLPVREGSAGSLVAPSAGTITVIRPDGTELVSAAAVTITSSVATYTLPTLVGADLGDGWTIIWALTVSGVVYTWRHEAIVCDYVPSAMISTQDLFAREPELRSRVPQAQGPRGSNEGWQVQIDEAYYDLIQTLIDRGEKLWQVRGMTGLRGWLRARSLMLCCRALSTSTGDQWDRKAGVYYSEGKAADGALVIQRDAEAADTRRGRGPYRLAPAGRPQW